MSRIALLFFVAVSFIGESYGYDYEVDNIGIGCIVCPVPVLNTSDEIYCCDDRCCSFSEFLITGYRLMILFGVAGIVAICGCCWCCICCCCRKKDTLVRNIAVGGMQGYRGFT